MLDAAEFDTVINLSRIAGRSTPGAAITSNERHD
jgi:hypothetical protein